MADAIALNSALEMAELAGTGQTEAWWSALLAAQDQRSVVLITSQMLHFLLTNEAQRNGISVEDQYTKLRLEAMENLTPDEPRD